MEKVVGADKGAEVPVIEPNKSGEASAAKKEDFYTKMQNKMIDLRKQSNIYLNHALILVPASSQPCFGCLGAGGDTAVV